MDSVFLDANILFAASYRTDARVLELWDLKDAQLLASSYVVEEARRNIPDPAQLARFHELLKRVKVISDFPTSGLPRNVRLPEKDRPVLLAAIEAKATHLLTGDYSHFGRFFGKEIEGVLILPPAEYFAQRRARQAK